jgi:type II secretory pathway component PulM
MHPDALREAAVQFAGVDVEGLMVQYVKVWWPKLKGMFTTVVEQYEGKSKRRESYMYKFMRPRHAHYLRSQCAVLMSMSLFRVLMRPLSVSLRVGDERADELKGLLDRFTSLNQQVRLIRSCVNVVTVSASDACRRDSVSVWRAQGLGMAAPF